MNFSSLPLTLYIIYIYVSTSFSLPSSLITFSMHLLAAFPSFFFIELRKISGSLCASVTAAACVSTVAAPFYPELDVRKFKFNNKNVLLG